jgi:hypothetical protein
MTKNASHDPYEGLRTAAMAAIGHLCDEPDTETPAARLRVVARLTNALRAYEVFRDRHVGGLGGRLELHRYAGRPADPAADAIAAQAREQYGTDEVEIEDPPYISASGDGAWVLAWVRVNNSDEETVDGE